MALNVSVLRSSFDLVVEKQPQLVRRFYEILFERHPELKPMFDSSRMRRQEEMLGGALAAVMDRLDDASWLEEQLGALGAKHVGYGVTPPMYDQVGQCLLAALAEAAGSAWTREVELAWSEAYGAIRDLMLAGAARADTAAVAG